MLYVDNPETVAGDLAKGLDRRPRLSLVAIGSLRQWASGACDCRK